MPRPPPRAVGGQPERGGGHVRLPARPDGEEEGEQDEEANVFCNVYDILPRVNSVARFFSSDWGVYHTGVQIDDREFAYGGHSEPSTGVFCARPRSAQGAVFKRQVPVGRSSLDPMELRQAIAEISRQWPGDTYDPFKHNCNHFTESLCHELTGNSAPPYINRFSKSGVVRAIFYRCVVPIGRCLERFYEHGGISYDNESDSGGAAEAQELGISGARGINQVLVEAATAQKLKANRLFKEGSYGEARDAYNKAMSYLGSMSRRTEEEGEVAGQAQKVRLALLLNLAACDLKQGEHARVRDTCSKVLDIEPDSQKALYRRGVALSSLGRLDEAAADLRRVLQLAEAEGDAGTARDVRRELGRVRDLAEAQKKKDKDFVRRMFRGVGSDDGSAPPSLLQQPGEGNRSAAQTQAPKE